ncbi:MAG: hypothetical protein HC831_07020 [Chloroflexia bacterium]|nr:hypothetical protein [Chloroflexia bacterium]
MKTIQNKFLRLIIRVTVVSCLVILLVGCKGLTSMNKTNTSAERPKYSSEKDIFIYGKPYDFKLLVQKESRNIISSSIQPYVVINGESHPMSIFEGWGKNGSTWTYSPPEQCPDVGFADDYGFKYTFRVEYERKNRFAIAPPHLNTNNGQPYHSRVFGAGTLRFDPYVTSYEPECWERNLGCVATFKSDVYVMPPWPGESHFFETELTLRNLTNNDEKLMLIQLVSYEGNPPNNRFEIVGVDHLPATVPCEGTFKFKLRYKPGYYKLPEFTRGYYSERGMIKIMIEGPSGQLIDGPHLYINYIVQPMAI